MTDAHLAARAIEHGAELKSTGVDFARVEGLSREDPLAKGAGARRCRRPGSGGPGHS